MRRIIQRKRNPQGKHPRPSEKSARLWSAVEKTTARRNTGTVEASEIVVKAQRGEDANGTCLTPRQKYGRAPNYSLVEQLLTRGARNLSAKLNKLTSKDLSEERIILSELTCRDIIRADRAAGVRLPSVPASWGSSMGSKIKHGGEAQSASSRGTHL